MSSITADALLGTIAAVTAFDAWYTRRMLRRFGRQIELNPLIRRHGVTVGLIGVTVALLAALWWVNWIALDLLVLLIRVPLAARQFWFWRKQWPLLGMR